MSSTQSTAFPDTLSIVGRWETVDDHLIERYGLTWLEDDLAEDEPAPPLGRRKGHAPPNKGKRYPAEPLTPTEVTALLDQCGGGYVGHRNRALIICMWRAGLRVSEALALREHHIDFEAGTVTVLVGKGGKRRTVGIDPWGADQIQAWIPIRAKLGLPPDAPLFCTVSQPNPGRTVNSAYVREMVREHGKRAGIPKRCHPHGLRHTLAVELAREGVPMHLIQRQLGHGSLATTAIYLQGIAGFEVVDAMTARRPPVAADPAPCPTCKGTGEWTGPFGLPARCKDCNGTGRR